MEFFLTGVVIVSAVISYGTACTTECSCSFDSKGVYVNCSNKYLEYIPTNLPNTMYQLQLQANKIKTIEENSFVNLTNLYLLYLFNNEISVIKENAFVNLPGLWYLYLYNNNITVLDPQMTRSMTHLQELQLQANKIKTIEENSFVNLTYLYFLYLDNNEISEIKENAFVNLPGLRYLGLTSNPLICNCSILPFWTWLTKRPSLGTSAICSNGTYVTNITSSALDKCNETVKGQWSNWGSWTACSMSCGNGTQYRNRYCNNPTPANGGSDCQGLNYESVSCNNGACPVSGQWSNWNSWTECSMTCGNGTLYRNRSCNNPTPANGGSDCQGLNYESVSCNNGTCPGRTCQCYNGGICTVGSDGQFLCTCVGKWKGEKCLESQCLSYDCGNDSCYVEPVNGSAKCFPQSAFCPSKFYNFMLLYGYFKMTDIMETVKKDNPYITVQETGKLENQQPNNKLKYCHVQKIKW